MPRGAAVIRYEGKRAVVWRIKYRDAMGRQVSETLGREPSWNRDRALRELGKRLAAVERGYRKPARISFADFSERFLTGYLPGRHLKLTTLESYRSILARHLPYFGTHQLAEIEARPELIDAYISLKTEQRLSAKTIHNQLLLLHLMLRRAIVWRLIQSNPVTEIDWPRIAEPETPVLSSNQIERLCAALDRFQRSASEPERDWWLLAKAIVLVTLGTALRRGELLALRWRAVDLEASTIEVREALVRGRTTTPKSRASRRVIELGPQTRAVLEQHRRRSRFKEGTTSSSATPGAEQRSTRARLPATTSNPHSHGRGSITTSGPFTTSATPRSPTPPPLATPTSTCKPAPATRASRSRSAICMPPSSPSPVPPSAASSTCSARADTYSGSC